MIERAPQHAEPYHEEGHVGPEITWQAPFGSEDQPERFGMLHRHPAEQEPDDDQLDADWREDVEDR